MLEVQSSKTQLVKLLTFPDHLPTIFAHSDLTRKIQSEIKQAHQKKKKKVCVGGKYEI